MDKKMESKIKSALRQIWRYHSEDRRHALKATSCAYCKSPRGKTEKYDCDHVQPIVPTTGWDSWDGYIDRLFEGLMVGICKKCHAKKTKLENDKRRKNKKEKK